MSSKSGVIQAHQMSIYESGYGCVLAYHYVLCRSEQKANIQLVSLMFIFLSGALAYFGSRYGAGTGPVYLGDVRCSGFEDSLINCSRSVFGDVSVNCLDHSEDASVFCPSEYQFVTRYSM